MKNLGNSLNCPSASVHTVEVESDPLEEDEGHQEVLAILEPGCLSPARTAGFVRQFYDAAPGLKPPPRPLSWLEVGGQLKHLYETLLQTSS